MEHYFQKIKFLFQEGSKTVWCSEETNQPREHSPPAPALPQTRCNPFTSHLTCPDNQPALEKRSSHEEMFITKKHFL